MIRIIGGEWRSRKLLQPATRDTRPMPDRVKAAIFSMLGAHYDVPGELPPLRVADVFAGGGSMGLEALSRGAAFCSFFERGPVAVDALGRNIEQLGAGDRSEVIRRDAWRAATKTLGDEPFDLIFLDPSYRDSKDASATGPVRRYLTRLAECAPAGCVLMLHHDRRTRVQLDGDDPWHLADERSIGSNAVSVLLRRP